jgi:hypothetical protein
MKSNEVVYRTSLDFDPTIEALRQCPQIQVRYDPELNPPGIAYVRYGSVSANIGRNGGIDIHYDLEEDLEHLLQLMKAKSVSRLEGSAEWVITKERFGRDHYIKEVSRLRHWIDYEDPWSPVAQKNRDVINQARSSLPYNYAEVCWRQVSENILAEMAASVLNETARLVQSSLGRQCLSPSSFPSPVLRVDASGRS